MAIDWRSTAADVLCAEDVQEGQDLLLAALAETFHGRVVMVTSVSGDHPQDPRRIWPPTFARPMPVWGVAAEAEAAAHPLLALACHTGSDIPATMADAAAAGWPLSPWVAEMLVAMGLSRHQLTVPAQLPGTTPELYGVIADEPYRARDTAAATELQPLLRGLHAHLTLLARLAPPMAGPDAAAAGPDDARPRQDGPGATPELRLTPRERLVLEAVSSGSTAIGLAARLGISPRTVHKHQENLYRKLGAVDRLSAVLAAQRAGILPAPVIPSAAREGRTPR